MHRWQRWGGAVTKVPLAGGWQRCGASASVKRVAKGNGSVRQGACLGVVVCVLRACVCVRADMHVRCVIFFLGGLIRVSV